MREEILKEENGKILVIKLPLKQGGLILGVGDEVEHYSNGDIVKIINIKKSILNDYYVYNYRPLYQFNEKLDDSIADQWEKHDAAFSNITKLVKQTNINTEVAKDWWDTEMKRRAALPKFKVMIKYPDSLYRKGEIVNAHDHNFILNKDTLRFYRNYPDVFKQIN